VRWSAVWGTERARSNPSTNPPAVNRLSRAAASDGRLFAGTRAAISQPHHQTPSRHQYDSAKPAERQGHLRQPLQHNCRHGGIYGIHRERDRHLPKYRAYLRCTDFSEDLVGRRASQSENHRIPLFSSGRRGMHSGCDAGDPTSNHAQLRYSLYRGARIRSAAIKSHCTGWRLMK
jgi:hypothetical protein